jgi:very-short-patch-repair endonuclease
MKDEDEILSSNPERSKFFPKWNTADPHFYYLIKDKRKEMRDQMTETEKILWEELKGNKLGVKFRRQHIIEYFIPDFVALSIKLIVEVDGEIHKFKQKYDKEREQFLIDKGFRIIRFQNQEILNNIEMVINKIKENI